MLTKYNLDSLTEQQIDQLLTVVHNVRSRQNVTSENKWMLDFVDVKKQRMLFDYVDQRFGENKLIEYVN